jgi:MoxR-like ATPase
MRLVRLLVPSEELDTVEDLLDDEGVDRVVTDERSREGARIVEFPVPGGAVETVLDTLRDAGVDDGAYTVVANAETANTERFAELEARYVEGSEEEDSVAHEEVRSKARSLLPDRRSYYAMTALSAIVATAGLSLDAAAVVIGSMAIVPQVGRPSPAPSGPSSATAVCCSTGSGRWCSGPSSPSSPRPSPAGC